MPLPSRVAFRAAAAALPALALAAALTLAPGGPAAAAAAPLPSGWPYATLELGVKDDAPPASTIRAWAPLGFVYQYLAGGAGRPGGWRDWNSPDGQYVTNFIQNAKNAGMTPAFTYYQLLQTRAGSGGEARVDLANINDVATMQAYLADYKVMLQRAAAFPGTRVVVHVEPDLWGYVQQASRGDDAASVPARVAATGLPELAGLPDTAAGLAQALVRLAGLYAPNVILAYHMSTWGTNVDPVLSDPAPDRVRALATRSAAFYRSLGARFDLTFAEFADRDDAYKVAVQGVAGAAWTAADYDNQINWLSTYGAATGHRIVLWQVPMGNRRMRAENNTARHYQSSQVETLLDDTARTRLRQYRDAGVIAFLFGTGADDQTHVVDFAGDGTTNPAPVNGNATASYGPEDDGGFFKRRAASYYATGALALDGGTVGPTEIVFTASAAASPASPTLGGTVTIQAPFTDTGAPAANANVQVNVYDAGGRKVFNKDVAAQSFATNQTRTYTCTWSPAARGTYTVKLGAFSADWSTTYYWNDGAGTIKVN